LHQVNRLKIELSKGKPNAYRYSSVGTSVVTSKAAIRGHFKTGHMNWPET
jgi:hypothetical protein